MNYWISKIITSIIIATLLVLFDYFTTLDRQKRSNEMVALDAPKMAKFWLLYFFASLGFNLIFDFIGRVLF